jgi:hypothetical protein
MRWLVGVGALAASVAVTAAASAEQGNAVPTGTQSNSVRLRWYKGNTHAHTLNSDGDSTPDDVVRWYREHGYHFLVLTDHNFVTAVDGLNAVHGGDEKFLVVKGEEVTERFEGKPLHVNALDLRQTVAPPGGTSVVDTLNRMVTAIRAEGGIPHINHPNFGWAISGEELQQVRGTKLFEIYNGHPFVNNLGGGGVPGLEDMWDVLLSRGFLLYGLAVDDAHVFKQPGNPDVAGPGRGWIHVRAPNLEARTLVDALERGEFYASTGVELQDVQGAVDRLRVVVKPVPSSKYRIQFIGKGGRLLQESLSVDATYVTSGSEGYVRARVIESNGRMAWVQPVIVGGKGTGGVEFAWLCGAAVVLGSLMQSRRRPRSAGRPLISSSESHKFGLRP